MNNFAITFRKYIAENRKQLLLWLAVALGGAVFLGVIDAFFGVSSDTSQGVYMVAAPIVLCCFASVAFSDMKRPAGRIAELTVPTTSFNRFAVRWILAIPLTMALLVAGAYIVELLRIICWPLFNDFGNPGDFTTFLTGKFLFPEEASVLTVYFMFLLLSLSFFFFGAIAWPRLSFLKSIIAQWTISTLLSTITVTSTYLFVKDHQGQSFSGNDIDSASGDVVFITFMSLLIIGLWVMAWLRVRESEVTDHLL